MAWYLWIVIAGGTALVLWVTLLQNLQHEGAHAFVVRGLFGESIKKFRPYPHRKSDGAFVWASVSFTQPAGGFGPTQWSWISGAPWLVNSVVIILATILNAVIGSPYASAVLLGWAATNLIDGANNVIGLLRARTLHESHSDLPRYYVGGGVPTVAARVGGVAWLVFATAAVVLGGVV